MNASETAPSARSRALQTVKTEHRALADVIHLLQHLLRNLRAEHGEPEFVLLAAALYYIDDFACRCHHPKEDSYLFPAVRRHVPDTGGTLTGLQAEHQRDGHYVRELHRLLVLYQAGAPDALKRLSASLDIYAAMLFEHMRKEEVLLDEHAHAVPDDEWHAIAEAFDVEAEPLFGAAPQKEFAKLRARITNMLPMKMRPHRAAGAD